jgi:hypothetical protein
MATSSDTELRDHHAGSDKSLPESTNYNDSSSEEAEFAPVRSGTSPPRKQDEQAQKNEDNEDDNETNSLARRHTTNSSFGREQTNEDWAEIERLMSRMFGRERKEHSEDEKTRHSGVMWKNLNVKGAGLGAALQPTVGDLFMGLPRRIKGLLTRGRKGAGTHVPVKTILHDFTVSCLSTACVGYV